MEQKTLHFEGTIPKDARPEVSSEPPSLPAAGSPIEPGAIDAYSETNIAHRLRAETGEDVHVMVRGDQCLVTGRVQEENIDKIRSLLTGMGIAVTDQPA